MVHRKRKTGRATLDVPKLGNAGRSSDLAKHLLWSTSRLSHHVGRMATCGLVSRLPSAHDGRGAVVSLTDLGWATLREAAPHHVETVRRTCSTSWTPRRSPPSAE